MKVVKCADEVIVGMWEIERDTSLYADATEVREGERKKEREGERERGRGRERERECVCMCAEEGERKEEKEKIGDAFPTFLPNPFLIFLFFPPVPLPHCSVVPLQRWCAGVRDLPTHRGATAPRGCPAPL